MPEIEFKMAEVPCCDFCGSREPAWDYSASDFVIDDGGKPLPPARSEGAWLACDACAACIEKSDWAGLAERGLLNPLAAVVVEMAGRKEALRMTRGFHDQFRNHRNRTVTRYAGA
jgi:hypothetical protein